MDHRLRQPASHWRASRSPHASCPYSGAERRELPAQSIEGKAAAANEATAAADPQTGEITLLPERHVRAGNEMLAISAGADAARRVLCPASNSGPLAGFCCGGREEVR